MRGGFTFCDVDIADLNLEYAPENENTFVFAPAEVSSNISTFDGHNGGYYYGSWTEPKEFVLRCFFEEKHINKGIMAKIYNLFKAGRTGKLVFQKRPWCYYVATVNSVPQLEQTNYLNGIVVINMTATYPYARSEVLYCNKTGKYRENLMANTAAYENENMLLPTKFENKTEPFAFLLGNPGTEKASLGIYVEGNAPGGLEISNLSNGQVMRLTKFTKAETTNVNKRIYIDSLNGKVMLKSDNSSEYAFIYHESGFLELEPNYPAHRNIYISYGDSDVITTKGFFPTDITNQYIYADNKWNKIISISEDRHKVTISDVIPFSSKKRAERTQIMSLNELSVKPIGEYTDMDITIEFIFKPTYA